MNNSSERRRYPRIEWKFVVRFRPHGKERQGWTTSTIKNIGEGGCFVYSNFFYKTGDLVDVAVDDPVFQDTMHFVGRVERCDRDGMAFGFQGMDDDMRREFVDTIFFLLKREY